MKFMVFTLKGRNWGADEAFYVEISPISAYTPLGATKHSSAVSKAGLRSPLLLGIAARQTGPSAARDTNVYKCCFEANILFSLVTDLDSSNTMVWNREVHITLRQI